MTNRLYYQSNIECNDIFTDDFQTLLVRLHDKFNNEVKEIISEVLKEDKLKDIKRNISIHSNIEKRKINGKEIDWWTSPAILIAVLGNNESLGGGSQRVNISGDKTTLDLSLIHI